MDTPPPVPSQPTPPTQPAYTPQTVVIPPPKSGCGCFAGGCMSVLVFCFMGFLALLVGGWFLCTSMLKKFTSNEPAEVAMTMPSEGEFSAANAKLTQLKEAMRNEQATTVSFSSADLNALIARHPDFARSRKRMHVTLADSKADLEMSVPLNKMSFPGFKDRWFNGSARFRFSYEDDTFNFDPDWIEANGHQITGSFLNSFASSFSRSFTTGFEDSVRKDDTATMWRRIKTITLQGDQMIITTEGPSA